MSYQAQHLGTVFDLPADVEKGIFVGEDGTIGGTYGVTLDSADAGENVAVVRSGPARVQAADATPARGGDVDVDANGRVVAAAGGTIVGEAEEAGIAASGGVHKLIDVNVYADK